ncbi:serine hydrolase domain-containing protein [Pedobacter soli]|uniref:CubicO group peptidase, beta-lactamase class C family n=1 Tax=Pedobacter soli TaxID=390242 RepID=A0A1G6TK26_9SPHI|nr:serine hydrolase domain-containing protein [Pedobacter soli]SDD29400.1 CubicO group peptidase, beta-lactamase class C family [Pedobacter soli]
MKTKTLIALFGLALLSYQNLLAQETNKSSAKINIDSLLEKKMSDAGIVGMSAAIILNKKVDWMKSYGYADKKNKVPFTSSTVMNIASVSKTFTGVCLMKAVEQGKVSLDEDINTYLPFKIINPDYPGEKITLRQLATHTSSLNDRYPFYMDSTYFYNGSKPEALATFIKNYFSKDGKYYSKENFLKSKPGSEYNYSNIATGLAGYILEIRTGEKLSDYGKKHIFDPLKMSHSGWSLAEIDTNKHARLYQKQGDTINQIPWYEGTTYPDGGIRTSVEELSHFFIALLNNGAYGHAKLLQKKSVDEMLRFQFNAQNKPENILLNKLNSGIFWATKLGATRIGHNGSDPGVRVFMLADLSKKIGVILFFNTSLSDKEESRFFDIYNAVYQYASGLDKKR